MRRATVGIWLLLVVMAGWISAGVLRAQSPATSNDSVLVEKQPGAIRNDNALKMKFCYCPAGKFRMGSPPGEVERQADEESVDVTLSREFWIGQFEVTQAQWKAVMGTNLQGQLQKTKPQPISGEGPDHPIYFVNYDDARDFCRRLTEYEQNAGRLPTGLAYRLPTEAEWEYACRAGTTTATAFGDRLSSRDANFDGNRPYNQGEKGPFLKGTTPVGRFQPNDWGIHDMHGNVWEWCLDGYRERLRGGIDPVGSLSAPLRVLRGGSWDYSGKLCRSANRYEIPPPLRLNYTGFRVVLGSVKR